MERKIAIVGLGYVGLPLAVAFGKKRRVTGFDINGNRVKELRAGRDRTGEVDDAELKRAGIEFTSDPASLKAADFIIVAVPTPVDAAHQPDLTPLQRASETIGGNLSPGTIVCFESTVYPGVTEEYCGPILEARSGLNSGSDFFLAYSPERINPGDKVYTLENIVKVVSGQTPEVLEVVARVYESVVGAGVHRAANIKTAEAAKVIENTQRDLNIALVNELAMIFDRIGIDTLQVLEAAGTKWNFLPFRPGLVGGHCIGVDPYYLTHKAEQLGYHPQVILAGRRINDGMGAYIAQQLIKLLIQSGIKTNGARIGILGLTFKENVPDLRNSRVIDIIRELREYRVSVLVHDACADRAEAKEEYGVELVGDEELRELDGVVLAVAHRQYRDRGPGWIQQMLRRPAVVIDVKALFQYGDFALDSNYWRL